MPTEVYAGRVEDYTEGRRVLVSVEDREVFVFERAGRFYAFENVCRHMGGPVGEGVLIGKVEAVLDETGRHLGDRFSKTEIHIACPWHGWEYDLATGQSFMGPGEPGVKSYDVTVERGDRVPGPYVAETFPVHVEEDYVVIDA